MLPPRPPTRCGACSKAARSRFVGRGPHQAEDGTWFADIIAPKEVLDGMPKDLGTVEVRAQRRLPAAAARQVSEGNRYEDGSVPKGVGIKE